MTPVRIVIADDHPIVRSGLMGLLASQDFDVVAEAADGRELVTAVQRTRADVVLTDLRMPELDGVGAIREMCAAHPGLKVLVLTTYDTDADILRAVEAGATGYLTKDSVPEQVVAALRTLLAGRKYISNEVAQLLADDVDGGGRPLHSALSEREFQIFCKIAAGKSVGDIADELHLSNKTVSTYRARVLEKMNLSSNADLTYYAIKNGLIQ
jgi:DNA-binding NarL/FixJ family response regulator